MLPLSSTCGARGIGYLLAGSSLRVSPDDNSESAKKRHIIPYLTEIGLEFETHTEQLVLGREWFAIFVGVRARRFCLPSLFRPKFEQVDRG